MRIAVISDVHSNLPALEAVMEDIGRPDPDEVWCLGDLVGYGADPDACTALVRGRDRVLPGRQPRPRRARRHRRRLLRGGGRRGRALDRQGDQPRDARLPGRPVAARRARGRRPLPREPPRSGLGVRAVGVAGGRVPRGAAPARLPDRSLARRLLLPHERRAARSASRRRPGTEVDLSAGKWLVNPGGVGQPRDGDPRAAWLLLDTDRWTAEFQRVEYDVERAAGSIRAAKLPRQLADRLYEGH